jgi:H+/Cl- antiporter ClcA
MIPISDAWYRRLLAAALLIGAAAGLLALVYSGVTGAGISRIFGAASSEPFSGEWWWIPLVSMGAVVVVVLRARAGHAGEVPGTIADARSGWVDPGSAPVLVAISAISLIVGASLGPAFGVGVAGGGFASWLVSRRKNTEEGERQMYALSGMAGGLGAVFSAPLFASVMASELSPTPKRDYVAAFIPQYIAATVGYLVFFGITGKVMMDAFEVPSFTFEWWHLIVAVGLGLLATVTVTAYAVIGKLVARVSRSIANPYAKALIFGALIGSISFALPLTATGGTSQLTFETVNVGTLAAGLLLAVLVAKMIAIHLSLEAGFLGGTVFPMLFLGGTAGVLVHTILPGVPAALAVAAMIAALPGTVIGAPVSFVLIGVVTVGIGVESLAPIGIAVITAHVSTAALQLRLDRRRH